MQINPKWIAHNNLYNESGEGYNPHPKYIASVASGNTGPKIVHCGMPYTRAQLEVKLQEAKQKFENLPDAGAREIWAKDAAKIQALLAA